VLGLLALAAAFGPLQPSWVERVYSGGFYPWIQPRLTRAANQASVALLDVAGLALMAGLVLWWGIKLRDSRGRGRSLLRLVIDTAALLALVYLIFLMTWGWNYRREPLETRLSFSEERVTDDRLRALVGDTIAELNRLHGRTADARWPELAGVPELLRPGFERAERELGISWGVVPGLPKASVLEAFFTRAAVDGMIDPFFLEVLINQEVLPFERPFVVAHEWSHLAGLADESEANFMGWVTCMQGPELTQYSALISVYGLMVSALPREERGRMTAGLAEGPRRDLRAVADRILSQSLPFARRASAITYDRFLRANRVRAGIASYARVVRLILGTRIGIGADRQSRAGRETRRGG
jgi:hypothetical protein